MNYVDPRGLSSKDLYPSFGQYMKVSWTEFKEWMMLPFKKDFWEWVIKWDYTENTSKEATAWQIIWWEVPGISFVADTRDLVASIQQCDWLNKECAIDVWLNMVWFAPFVWSAKHVKHVDKLKHVDEISSAAKWVNNLKTIDNIADFFKLDSSFKRTNKIYQWATIYTKNGNFYYIDNFHKNHIEVFNKNWKHLWELNPFTNYLDTSKADPSKILPKNLR